MKTSWLQWGMPITIDINDPKAKSNDFDDVKDYFNYIDTVFSTYREDSEISKINNHLLSEEQYSVDMKQIFKLSEETKTLTNGYFDIKKDAHIDPSGIVKGWAIYKASQILKEKGYKNFYIDAGGDIEVSGQNEKNENWNIGIKSPFNPNEIGIVTGKQR